MARCPACNAEIEPSDRFCRSCGTSLAGRCPACGDPLRPGAEFCASCGTAVRSSVALEHRLVTAIYVDLVGSTGLAERLDPENLTAVVGSLHEIVRMEVEDRQGRVGAFVGDGVLGVFGLPAAHEDDPDRALRATRSILRRIDALNRDAGARLGVDLAARIGVNTGDLLAPAGEDASLGTLAGDVLNVAARLQEVASPGEVVVSERTARSAPRFRFDDLGLIDVRGRARAIHAYRVAGETEATPLTIHAPFLGRKQALESLRNALKQVVAEGSPRHVAVIGDPGVGKSRLVREFLDWAHGADASLTALIGRCLPYGEDITYRPLTEMLAELTGITPATDAETARQRIRDLVDGLSERSDDEPVSAEALLRMVGLSSPDADGPTPRRTRELLRATWRVILSDLADDGPVVMMVEDVHWAGDALFDLLEHIVRRAAGPILLITPARPEVFAVREAWRDDPNVETVQVPPLEPDQARQLAGRLLTEVRLPAREADELARRADGNPFFIEELVRQMALRRSDGSHHDEPVELPVTIQGVVSARIDLLGPRDRRVLQAASIMGRIFWPSAIGHLTGLVDAEVAEALDSLEAMQLVRVNLRSSLEGEVEYLFQHSLIGESAYARLSRPDLARMHAALAEWLERRAAPERPEVVERLAYHTAKAHRAAEATDGYAHIEVERLRSLALERLLAAAERARERAAFGRSRDLAEEALTIAHGPEDAWRAHEQLGLTHMAQYDGDAAWEALTTAIDLYQRSESPDSSVLARLAAAAVQSPLRWTATMRQLPTRQRTLDVVRLGLRHAGTTDSIPLCQLLTAVAFVPFAPGHGTVDQAVTPDEALAAGHRAAEMARRLGSPTEELASLDAIMNHALGTGRIQQAATIATNRLELAEAVSDPREIGDTYAMAAWLSFDLGDYEEARDRGARGFNRTVDDAPYVALHTLSWATQARVQTGDWDGVVKALHVAQELLDRGPRGQPPLYAAALFASAAMVAEFRGKQKEADRLLAVLTDVWSSSDLAAADRHPHARWAKQTGPIYLRRGEYDVVELLIAAGSVRRIGREGDRLGVESDLVVATGAWDRADEVIESARSTGAAYGLQALQGHADRLEGLASIAAGDRTGGRALLARATARFGALGDRWEAHRTELALAESGGDVDPREVHSFFKEIGAVEEVERARRLLPD